MEVASTRIYSVEYRGATSGRRPSTVTMIVDSSFALKAAELFEITKKNESRDKGLMKLELVAFYDGDEEIENKLKELNNSLERTLGDD